MGLRTRLLLLVLFPAIPGLLLAVYSNLQQRDLGRFRVEQDAVRMVQLAAVKQLGLIDTTRQHLKALSSFPEALGTNRPAYDNFLAGMRQVYSDYAEFGLLETNGEVVASSRPEPRATNLAERTFFQRVLQTGDFAIGSYEPPSFGSKPSLIFGHPVFDKKGRLGRVVYAALDLSVLNRAASKTALPESAVIHVLDRDGVILTRYPKLDSTVGRAFGQPAVIASMRDRREGIAEIENAGDVVRLCGFTQAGTAAGTNLIVSVGIPLSMAYASTDRMLLINLAILGAVVFLAMLAAWVYAERSILRPVRVLTDSTRQLTGGDLSVRTGLGDRAGELNQLAQAFDSMAEGLQQQRIQNELFHAELEDRVKERTAQLRQSNNELEAFSYSVSHDLRAPLRHIHGYSQRLEEEAASYLPEEQRRYIKLISGATKRMGHLIDDLLEFSRMGRAELIKTEVRTDDLIQEILHEMKRDLEGRKIEWIIGPLPTVFADRAMLKQAWANLLSNAVKYTRQRDVARISISARRTENEHEFCIQDNGAGFDMRYAEKLFRVFERLHHADEFEGTGIGLANVRRVVLRHHGRTWAEGKLGVGATFCFSLPVRDDP